jgi:ubiquinone/menaquinone biosynthesis C-methylase UbiE
MIDDLQSASESLETVNGRVDHARLRSIFRKTPASYNKVIRLTTLGMDYWWKRRMFSLIPSGRTYDRILDLGSGTGNVTLRLAKQFPKAEVIGIDLTPENVDFARARAVKAGLGNVQFQCMAVEGLCELPGKFDLVTGSYIPKLVETQVLAQDLAAKTSQGSVVVLHDFTLPQNQMLRVGFDWYWCIVSRVMSLMPAWKPTADHLGTIIRRTTWVTSVEEALTANGFAGITTESQPLQVAAIVRAERPDISDLD